MSILKSPVFYLGLLLVWVVGGALIAPFVIDWNSYRDNLETYGRKISGREVAISGPISVRLFPWPRLVADDVSVANPKGSTGPAMLHAGKVTMHLALSGLFSGQILVESIDVEKPILNLLLDQTGQGNWHFTPDQALAQTGLLNNVLLEKINIVDGTLNFKDAKHGLLRTLHSFTGFASAAAMEGPWRIIASAKDGETPLDLSWSSAAWKANTPLKFGMKISPLDGAFPTFTFDGERQDDTIKGKVGLVPVVSADGRTSLEGNFKPLTFQSNMELAGDIIKLDAIHIVPADSKDSGTLIEGDGVVDLSRGAKVDLHLKAPHVDVDGLAGVSSLRIWRAGGIMGLINTLLTKAPPSLDFTGSLDVSSLTIGGESLENVSLKATAAQSAIRVKDFTADLPGRSRMKFSGIIFPGDGAAELGGNLAFESNDTRGFAQWLWPENKVDIGKIWTGARGRLKAQTDVNWGGKRFGFQNLQYEFDGLGGKAELAVALGKIPAIDLKLSAKQFDLGSYISGGLAGLVSSESFITALSSDNGFEKRLQFDFDRFMLNGVSADRVALNYASSISGFEVKKFSIGSVEGAEVAGNGLVLIGPEGPSGEVKFAVGAERPQGLMRLLGLMPNGPDPRWATGFGKTDMKAEISVKPGAKEPLLSFSLTGDSGPYHIVSSGTARDLAKGADSTLGFSGTVTSADAHDVARLLGIDIAGREGGEGSLSITADGNAKTGFRSALDFEGFATSVGFSGSYFPQANYLGFSGTFNVAAEDAGSVSKALLLPFEAEGVGPLSLKLDVLQKGQGLSVSALRMDYGDQTIVGKGDIDGKGLVQLKLGGGNFKLSDLLAIGFTQESGSLQAAWPFGIRGEVLLNPLSLVDPLGVKLNNATVLFTSRETTKSFELNAQDDVGSVILKGELLQKGIGFALDGTAQYPMQLKDVTQKADGTSALQGAAIVNAHFHSDGRSVAGLLSSLTGSGTVDLRDFSLSQLSPDRFFAGLHAVTKAEEIQAEFAKLFSGTGVALGLQKLNFEAKDGAVNFVGMLIATPESEIVVTPHVDLINPNFITTVTLKSKTQLDLPPLRIVYEGLPGAINTRSDVAALSAKLGTALIAKDIAALDKVQKEQEKLVADQAAQVQADKDKFEAFQAQRLELRQRLKERKVFAAQRALDAARYKAAVDAAVIAGEAMVKEETRRFLELVK